MSLAMAASQVMVSVNTQSRGQSYQLMLAQTLNSIQESEKTPYIFCYPTKSINSVESRRLVSFTC